MLPGYFQGKKRAEETLALRFPQGGVWLRPGFIYGTRNVGGIGIPLGAVGEPPNSTITEVPCMCSLRGHIKLWSLHAQAFPWTRC